LDPSKGRQKKAAPKEKAGGVSDRTKVLFQVLLFLALVASVVFVITSPDLDPSFLQGLSSTLTVIVVLFFVLIGAIGLWGEIGESVNPKTVGCKHCGKKVSVEAQTCVHCGCPNPSK
tara:strand:- start:122 stop:472 length:351 start_codon:yes stop_codon:yes gene_type:complete